MNAGRFSWKSSNGLSKNIQYYDPLPDHWDTLTWLPRPGVWAFRPFPAPTNRKLPAWQLRTNFWLILVRRGGYLSLPTLGWGFYVGAISRARYQNRAVQLPVLRRVVLFDRNRGRDENH